MDGPEDRGTRADTVPLAGFVAGLLRQPWDPFAPDEEEPVEAVDLSPSRVRLIAPPVSAGDRLWVHLYSSSLGDPRVEGTPLTLRFDLAGVVVRVTPLERIEARVLAELELDVTCRDVTQAFIECSRAR